jgi:hypothetical protein
LLSGFKQIVATAGGEEAILKLFELADEAWNPGLKYTNMRYNGFFAVKVTKNTHIAEYFGFTPETILTPYDQALMQNAGGITAKFFCHAQLTTTAGAPGSLVRSDNCSVIQFDNSHPTLWKIPFPLTNTSPTTKISKCGSEQCTFPA